MSHEYNKLGDGDMPLMEKLAFNLSSDNSSREFNCTLRWMIYKIVEANNGITYAHLKKILRGEYGIDKRVVDIAISTLTSRTLFCAITKWKAAHSVGEVGLHLYAKTDDNQMFKQWMDATLAEFPELAVFKPRVEMLKTQSPRNRQNHSPNTDKHEGRAT